MLWRQRINGDRILGLYYGQTAHPIARPGIDHAVHPRNESYPIDRRRPPSRPDVHRCGADQPEDLPTAKVNLLGLFKASHRQRREMLEGAMDHFGARKPLNVREADDDVEAGVVVDDQARARRRTEVGAILGALSMEGVPLLQQGMHFDELRTRRHLGYRS